MYKRYFTFIVVFLITLKITLAQHQGSHISFDKLVHDYGKIEETGGLAKYNFEFTNTGSTPLIINRVKPTCGCTSSNYTKKPIKSGEKGFVSAEYNPKNRPGPFSKTIRVYSNSQENPNVVLRIKGDVNPKPRTIKDDYPQLLGPIRLDNTQFAFLHITNKEQKIKTLNIINISDKPVTLDAKRVPSYINLTFSNKTLKPNEKGTIQATIHGEKITDLGYIRSRISLIINGEDKPQYRLATTANVKEDFSHLTPAQRANAPHIKFKNELFDFETITEGEKVTHKFEFENTGKSDLIIRKVHTTCGCTAVAPPKGAIQPGEKSVITVTFNSKGKLNKQHKTITVYSNDPHNSETKLAIRGTVKKNVKPEGPKIF